MAPASKLAVFCINSVGNSIEYFAKQKSDLYKGCQVLGEMNISAVQV